MLMTQLETRSRKPRIAKGETKEQSKALIKPTIHKGKTLRLKTALSQALVPWSIE